MFRGKRLSYNHNYPRVTQQLEEYLNPKYHWFQCEECGGTFIVGTVKSSTVRQTIAAHTAHLNQYHGATYNVD